MSKTILIEGCRADCPYEHDWECRQTDKEIPKQGIPDWCPLLSTPPTCEQGAREMREMAAGLDEFDALHAAITEMNQRDKRGYVGPEYQHLHKLAHEIVAAIRTLPLKEEGADVILPRRLV